MGKLLVEKITTTLPKIKWPETPTPTQLGRQTYDVGLEKVEEFRDDPSVLGAALRTFQSGDSQPYAFAGVAYTLLAAAREKDGSYAEAGLEAAMTWLEKAQEMAPDQLEINMIEAFIYVYGGRYADARIIIDYLKAIDPKDFHVLMAEIAHWQQQKKVPETVQAYQTAIELVDTVPHKLRLRNQLGDCYLQFRMYPEALEVYKEAVHFAKDSPWLWHNMSLAYWHLEEYEEADRCNRQALKLGDIPEAQQMQSALKEKLDTGGLAARLFGR